LDCGDERSDSPLWLRLGAGASQRKPNILRESGDCALLRRTQPKTRQSRGTSFSRWLAVGHTQKKLKEATTALERITGSRLSFRVDMSRCVQIEIELPDDLARFRLPAGVQHRLRELLDKQDGGQTLNDHEKREAEGLVDVAELLSFLRLRTERTGNGSV
jgi:hypothetical protein